MGRRLVWSPEAADDLPELTSYIARDTAAQQHPTSTITMQAETFKQAAHALIDTLPDDASWRELAYVAALRASIQQGLAEADAGELVTQDDIEAEFGVSR